jgi:hypothetical protein
MSDNLPATIEKPREEPTDVGGMEAPRQAPEVKPQKQSIRERVATRYRQRRTEREYERKPEIRQKRLKERKESLKLGREELEVRRQERRYRFEKIKESKAGYAAGLTAKGIRYAQRIGGTPRSRVSQIPPQYAYQGGLTGMSRFGGPRPSIQRVSPISVPIYSMGGVSSGGYRGYAPQTQERYSVPRGTIKSYWSKKVKSLAKANVRKYGPDEGIARTRSIAEELGWKMQ